MAETIDVTVRWSGPADVGAIADTYKVESNVLGISWDVNEAGQAATSPYVSPSTTLASNASYGATSVVLTSGTGFSSAGYGWIDDALVQWTGKSTNTLTGVTWHSGYGTYAAGSVICEAHESYTATLNIDLENFVCAVFRITHIDADGNESAPLYIWYFHPPAPASRDHCVVVVPLASDLGVEWATNASVQCTLAADNQFSEIAGLHLNQESSTVNANVQTVNAFGLAIFQCWKSSARAGVAGGADAAYTFVLDSGSANPLTVTAETIPDRDWVLLSQIATA
jgi:hypothetical protein